MTMTVTPPKPPFGAITVHRAVTAVHDFLRLVEAMIAARRAAAQLRRLSPRMLEDIGLTLADIERLERGERF